MIEDKLVLNELNSFLEDFINLDPKKQRWLMTAIGRKADSLNRKRVTKQVDLAGKKYVGRKREAKKKMFLKLKQRKNMFIKIQGDEAVIGYKGFRGRMAYEHHHGVKMKKSFVARSSSIGRGRQKRVKGDDPCTYEQAGILFSFVLQADNEGIDPEPKVSMKQVSAAQENEKSGRNQRRAVMKLFQEAYTAAEAGRTIAKWDMQITRVGGNKNPYYYLPSRHLLGVTSQDLPVLMKYAEERLQHYLSKR